MDLTPYQMRAVWMIITGCALLFLEQPLVNALQGSSSMVMALAYGLPPVLGLIFLVLGIYRYGKKKR